jgi:4a-hydroxytetrahydrobiopterin dehydratase
MTTTLDLNQQQCLPCKGDTTKLTFEQATVFAKQLHPDWKTDGDNTSISRAIKFKGFPKVVLFVNTLSWLAEKEQHHPDISFGYGYCTITFTTHAIDGLSVNDFICAAKVDALL